ncbi:CubicO group peptidase, beta-lactamase class C family [Parapedobacter luteus]|uniref:CubicO group peptidase, beta-lactamase class C family n=1 Tax=Parapedobacter luteus TaxID=623280 RepID=A0A1T5CVK7_9SPHI|nr:serine hydrolase [Parapedobacter luteus]SKB63407.1 CubicO group peptidase, beta-lactamase class C family [Parapedobacter luteus]
MKGRHLGYTVWLLCCLLALPRLELKGQPGLGFDEYVAKVLDGFQVPGMAIAVVKDGRTVLSTGYGVKTLGSTDAVDAHTLFPIASNTKAFTATALALLVEEGTIRWDEPVIRYMPWFRMADPWVTEALTVRDLLVHRSGIAPYAGDLLQFPPSTYSRKEVVEKLRYLPLTTSFRSTYAYDNVLYLAAGQLIEEVSGMTWEQFVQTRILNVVGMTESIPYIAAFDSLENVATSHIPIDGTVKPLYTFSRQSIANLTNPAGGMLSNATDMARWLTTQLDSGKTPRGERLFSPKTARELWTGVTPMPIPQAPEWLAPAQQDFTSYALGFRTFTYRGIKAVSHGGALDGFVSHVIFFPSLDLGIAVLTNQQCTNAYQAVINRIVDDYIDSPPFDWLSAYLRAEKQRLQRLDELDSETATKRATGTSPSLDLGQYTGKYRDDWYGDISIANTDSGLRIRFEHSPLLTGRLEHWQYDTFVAIWDTPELRADAFVTFMLDHQGKVARITMTAVSARTDVSFDFHDLDIRPVPAPKTD